LSYSRHFLQNTCILENIFKQNLLVCQEEI